MKAIYEICVSLRNGKSVPQSADAGGLPITRIETIADGTIDPARVGFANLVESECSDWLLQNGDILISHINSTKHLGKCAIYHGEPPALVHGMNLLAMRVDEHLALSRYVYRMLSSPGFRKQLPRITKDSVNQSSFNLSNFKNLQLPLPPLAEQKRIAAILDAADAMRAKRRESLALLDTLLQSTFFDMFGDPITNPMGWTRTTLTDFAIKVTDGDHHTPNRTESGIKLLSARNVLDGDIDLTNTDFVGTSEYKRMIKRCHPEQGDILISCSGSIGRVSRIRFNEPIVLVRSAALVKIDHNIAVTEFVEYLLRTPSLKSAMLRLAKSSSQANLFQKPIRNLPVLAPPLDLQRRFAAIVESVEKQKAIQRAHLAELDTLFSSLQQRAFNGDL